MWERLLQRIWGETDGWAAIARTTHEEGSFRQKFYKYPGQLHLLISDLEVWSKWASVYFCPALLKEQKKTKENVIESRVIWIDYDRSDIESVQPRPTLCWRTSKGKHQAVWLLKEPVSPRRGEETNKYMAYQLDGDTGSWDMHHYLRMPGSKNFKYDPPQNGKLLWDDGPSYDIEDLEPTKQDIEYIKEELNTPNIPNIPNALPTYQEVITREGKKIPRTVWNRLNEKPTPDEDWSEVLWQIERLLLEAGLSPEDVFVIARESPWNKYKRDSRSDEELWRDVHKAASEGQAAPGDGLNWMSLPEILAYTDRPEWLVDGVWMQEAVGWIVGTAKSYKSVTSLDLALSVASGEPFLGKYEVKNPGPVLMIQEEDPAWRVAPRVSSICEAKNIATPKMFDDGDSTILEIPGSDPVPMYAAIGDGFLFQDEEMQGHLEDALDHFQPRLVIFDPWFMLSMGVDEYKSGEIAHFLDTIKKWRDQYGCAIALIHHFRKGSGQNDERIYGSGALYWWSENTLYMKRSRGSNITVMARDIKDAEHLPDISVEFVDIMDEYSINVSEEKQSPSEDKIVAFLASAPVGADIPKKRLVEATGISDRTVRKRLKELHDQDLIMIEYKGQGGAMVIQTTPALYDMEGVEMNL